MTDVYVTTGWKHACDQYRLLWAERLMYWAMKLAPKDHPDSIAIVEAVHHLASRKPVEVRWK